MLADGVQHLDGVGLPRSVRNIARELLRISHRNSALNGTYKDGVSRGLRASPVALRAMLARRWRAIERVELVREFAAPSLSGVAGFRCRSGSAGSGARRAGRVWGMRRRLQ
jgi:hypothetical protein